MKNIAAMTTVRGDGVFLRKWIDYYGGQFGKKNLFVFLDGHDQVIPDNAEGVNFNRLPHQPLERVPAMRRRARVMSQLGRGLHRYFDMVIATDVDEFIVVDPDVSDSLAGYLSERSFGASVSSLGLDVGQHMTKETALDTSQPYLAQRGFAHLSSRYTKPCISTRPITWGSGMHRIKGRNFKIDPNLYLMHFGMVDYEMATGKTADADRIASGWSGHLSRREALFKIITEAEPLEGDVYMPVARRVQSLVRPLFALNKPAMIRGNPVITIPQRFREINL